MKIQELIDYLEDIAPTTYQASYDNSGLLVGDREAEINGVLVSLDCIESIVDEAIRKECNVVVSHHPIIFDGLKRLTGADYVQRTVIKAIKHDIALYAIHTNLDSVLYHGVNTEICDRLGIIRKEILLPDDRHSVDDLQVGSGMVGDLEQPLPTTDFLRAVSYVMQTEVIKHTGFTTDYISRVAVCGGSGSFLLSQAKSAGADIYITSDYKYHEYFDADGDIIIADIGHYESEQYTIDLLHRLIGEKFSTFAALKTELVSNPVSYFL